METVLLDIFFSHSRKIQTAKTQEDKKVKVWSWYNRNERGEHVCLEKRSSKNSSAVNQKAWPTFFSVC